LRRHFLGNTTIVDSAAGELRRRGDGEAAERLVELERLLAGHRAALPDADQLLDALRVLAGELAAERPNRVTLRGILAGLAELQSFAVDVTTSTVTIEILQTTPAPERDFTAISELAFQGRPA
jgi:hypothetical protein